MGAGTWIYVPHRMVGRPAGRPAAELGTFWKVGTFFWVFFVPETLIFSGKSVPLKSTEEVDCDVVLTSCCESPVFGVKKKSACGGQEVTFWQTMEVDFVAIKARVPLEFLKFENLNPKSTYFDST